MQRTAATVTQAPISHAVPGPQAGVHASGTHRPVASHTLPVPQKSEHVFGAASGTHWPLALHTFPSPQKSEQVFSAGVGGEQAKKMKAARSGAKRSGVEFTWILPTGKNGARAGRTLFKRGATTASTASPSEDRPALGEALAAERSVNVHPGRCP